MSQPVLVIMAGGRGERLWPLSRGNHPKQLLTFRDGQSLLQESVARIRPLTVVERIYVVVNSNYVAEIKGQLPFIPERNILIEPEGRNTAPCVGLAATYIGKHIQDEDPVVAFLPSDSLILNEDELRRALRAGFSIAGNQLAGVIYGMTPTRPERGFGYIQLGEKLGSVGNLPYHRVAAFKEKPPPEIAEEYFQSKEYLWNGGIFVWRLSVLKGEIQRCLPQLAEGLKCIEPFIGTAAEIERLGQIYPALPAISVDYGILEKNPNMLVVPSDYGWDDLGSWSALKRLLPPDESGNVVLGEFMGVETQNCIIYSPQKMVATLGVTGLIIVETNDALLVCAKERDQEVKKLLAKLAAINRQDLL